MSLEPCRPEPALTFVNEIPAHAQAIEALLTRAFGPGRFAKVSERVREFADFAPEQAAGEAAVLLVGDMPFFGRVGFSIATGVVMPGPVDPKRVLGRSFRNVALTGPVRAR